MLKEIFNLIKPYVIYIILALFALYLLNKTLDLIFRVIQERLRERRERKREKKKRKQEEKQMNAYRYLHANNWLLNEILKTRIVVFKGLAGKGKTLLMQVFSKFLVDQFYYTDLKNYRYNKIMNPEYLARRQKLKEDGFLPVYSINLKDVYCPTTGLKVQENGYEILTQQIKANSPAILQIDEMSSIFPKSNIYTSRFEKDPQKQLENSERKETVRKIRHYGMWLFGTEQDGDDIDKDIRQFGSASIHALTTNVSIMRRGRLLQKIKIFARKWFPGWFVSSARNRFKECLFLSDRIKTFFKLFLPAYFMYEKQFYINRNKIYGSIKDKYTLFKTLFEFEGKKYWLHFTNDQKLNYNTTAYRSEYDDKFDSNGMRKANA